MSDRKHKYPKTRAEIEENGWIEVDEERYWEMLEILPPAKMVAGGFAVGEPLSQLDGDHRDASKTVYDCFIKFGGRYFEKPNTLNRLNDMDALRGEVKAQFGIA